MDISHSDLLTRRQHCADAVPNANGARLAVVDDSRAVAD
jgi:hypothetical protein